MSEGKTIVCTNINAMYVHVPECCPITGLPFFMWIGKPGRGQVPTYGGPFDSYTIPVRDKDGGFCREHFDQDEGCWIEGTEAVGLTVVYEGQLDSIRADVARLTQELAGARGKAMEEAAVTVDDMATWEYGNSNAIGGLLLDQAVTAIRAAAKEAVK